MTMMASTVAVRRRPPIMATELGVGRNAAAAASGSSSGLIRPRKRSRSARSGGGPAGGGGKKSAAPSGGGAQAAQASKKKKAGVSLGSLMAGISRTDSTLTGGRRRFEWYQDVVGLPTTTRVASVMHLLPLSRSPNRTERRQQHRQQQEKEREERRRRTTG